MRNGAAKAFALQWGQIKEILCGRVVKLLNSETNMGKYLKNWFLKGLNMPRFRATNCMGNT